MCTSGAAQGLVLQPGHAFAQLVQVRLHREHPIGAAAEQALGRAQVLRGRADRRAIAVGHQHGALQLVAHVVLVGHAHPVRLAVMGAKVQPGPVVHCQRVVLATLLDALAGHAQQGSRQVHRPHARVVQKPPQGLRVGHARLTRWQRLHPCGKTGDTVGVLHYRPLRSPL